MTDTSRPTVEALIRESRTTQGYSEGDLRSVIKSMAEVLGALLTERDDLARSIKKMHGGYGPTNATEDDYNAGAHDAIGDVLDLFRDGPRHLCRWTGSGDLCILLMGHDGDHERRPSSAVLFRGVQGDAKLATNPTHPETEPSDEPEQNQVGWEKYLGPDRIIRVRPAEATEPSEPLQRGPVQSINHWHHDPRSRVVYDAETKGEKP